MKKNMKQFDKCELINIDKIYNIASYSNDNIVNKCSYITNMQEVYKMM